MREKGRSLTSCVPFLEESHAEVSNGSSNDQPGQREQCRPSSRPFPFGVAAPKKISVHRHASPEGGIHAAIVRCVERDRVTRERHSPLLHAAKIGRGVTSSGKFLREGREEDCITPRSLPTSIATFQPSSHPLLSHARARSRAPVSLLVVLFLPLAFRASRGIMSPRIDI